MRPAIARTPRTRRWTRAEYERLIELGVFRPDERLELLDGGLVVREPRGSRHAAAIRRVVAALRAALDDVWQIDSQLPLALDDDSQPEPDVLGGAPRGRRVPRCAPVSGGSRRDTPIRVADLLP